MNVEASWLEDFIAREQLPGDFAEAALRVCEPIAERVVDEREGPGFVVGICGAQGAGKSTIAAVVAMLLEGKGLSVSVLSLDDLYLGRQARLDLARTVHPLLATRGVPGTHDPGQGVDVLDALARRGEVVLPRFDKATDDRVPDADRPRVEGPVDVILFEGWCVGAVPQPDGDLVQPINDLERFEDPDGVWRRYVNAALAGPYRPLFDRLDLFVLLQAPGFDAVLRWRLEQERKLRGRLAATGGGQGRAMSDGEVARFIAHYERLTRWILAEAPGRADLAIRLDADRRPL